jgi:hypothetical protein
MTSGGRVNKQAANREFVMNIKTATTTGALLLAMVVSGTPALASSSAQGGRDRRQSQAVQAQPNKGGGASRAQANYDRAGGRQAQGPTAGPARQNAPRQPVQRQFAPQPPAPRQNVSRQPMQRQFAPQPPAPRQNVSRQPMQRQFAPQPPAPRQNVSRQPVQRQFAPQPPAPRQFASRQPNVRQYGNRPYDGRAYSNGGYGYRPYIPRVNVRLGLGLSIFAGRPYGFRFDYGWAPPYAHRFPMRQGIGYGGMSFLIDPDDAAIYVDGEFIGISRDFDGQPVPLAAGWHEIELQAEGCEPVVFDITVRPGQVIPYRGSLFGIR